MKSLILSVSLIALGFVPHAFAVNASVDLIGNPDSNWTTFDPPHDDGTFSLAASPGSIIPGFFGGEMVSYNAETHLVRSAGGHFHITGSFNFADSSDMQNYVAGFASGPLNTLSDSFQRLQVSYDPFSPAQPFSFDWTYFGSGFGGSSLGYSAGNLTDTVAYDITAAYAGSDNWSLLGDITVDGNTVWDSSTTPISFLNSALVGETAHYYTGVTEGGGPSVSISSGTFSALVPEPARAALSVIGLAAALFTRRRGITMAR